MKITSPETQRAVPPSAGTVRVAVWKDGPEVERYQDVFTNYSSNIFFDFSKPLKLLESPGWSSSIRTNSEGDFFVFTSDLLSSNHF